MSVKSKTSDAVEVPESQESMEKVVNMLLNHTSLKISEGNKDDALAALLHAIRISSGENSIIKILDQAKKQVANDHSSSAAAVAEATKALKVILKEDSLLSGVGRGDILRDAFEDGSSLICQKCNGLVKRARWEAHNKSWCPALDIESAIEELSDDEN
jgi:hypothetical protein